MENLHCFICRSPLPDSKIRSFRKEETKLEEQVQVIFIITKLMGIPSQECTNFLSANGNPSDWIFYCKDCSLIIQKSRKTYEKLLSLQKSFSLLKTQLKNYIKVAYEGAELTTENYVNTKNNKHIPEYLLNLYLSRNEEEYGLWDASGDYDEDAVKIEVNEESSDLDFCENDGDDEDIISEDLEKSLGRLEDSIYQHEPDLDALIPNDDDEDFNKDDDSAMQNNLEENNNTGEGIYGRRFKCQYCEKHFKDKYAYESHTRKLHTKEASHACKKCGETFFDTREVRRHFKQAHPKEIMATRSKHLNQKTSNNLLRGIAIVCDICGRNCKGKSTYRTHMLSHTGEKPYLCELCSERFLSVTTLTWHKHYAHYEELNLEPFKCKECGKCLRNPPALKYHIAALHAPKKDFKCDICGNEFVDKYKLNTHIKIYHEKRKITECNVCGEKLFTKLQASRHRQKHSGVYDFNCEICQKGFREKGTLQRHLKYHSQEFSHKRKSRLTKKVVK